MRKFILTSGVLLALSINTLSFALNTETMVCGIEGSALRTDGTKIHKTATVSSDWNNKKALPENGYYQLDLDSAVCGKKITVYVNGYTLGEHRIPRNGHATVNITLKGSSDIPVR